MHNTRRQLIQTVVTGSALLALGGCGSRRHQNPHVAPDPLSLKDQALADRLSVLRGGGALIVTALSVKEGVNIFDEKGSLFYAKAELGPRGGDTYSYSSNFGVPKTLHATWRKGCEGNDVRLLSGGIASGGVIAGDYIVPVASRIPDDLLADLRRDPRGSFRLKIRLHDDGVLVGWDIQRRPGFDPKKRDRWGEAEYVGPVHSFAGGDFREALIFNGKPERKGWYIHPKTGELIETDT